MLGHSQNEFDLALEALTDSDGPAIATATPQLHLDAVREPAVEIY